MVRQIVPSQFCIRYLSLASPSVSDISPSKIVCDLAFKQKASELELLHTREFGIQLPLAAVWQLNSLDKNPCAEFV
jgi:hypothetical protein